MTATIIDGKAFAARVRGQVAEHVARLKADHGITPGLAVVLVGEDPASQVYVRSKGKQTVEAGMKSVEHKLDASTSEADLLAVVDRDQTALIKLIESKGIDVIPLKLRHSKMLGGGFHCVTLDVRRSGTMQRYFD